VATLCALSVAGCKKKTADDAEEPTVTVQAEKAAVGSITETVEADTVLLPQAQAAIVPKVSSPIRKFFVQRGSRVHAGQTLAVLENADLAADVVDTKGILTQAEATFATTTKGSVLEDTKSSELAVAQAKANLDVQKTQTAARQNLLAQGAIPARDYETSKAALVAAQATYDLAEQHLSLLKGVSRAATVQGAEGGLQSARGKYQAAQSALNYANVTSPINGVVTDRPLFPGEMAQAGQPLLTVMDTSNLIAKVHLPQEKTAGLKLGDAATVNVQGAEDKAEGKISLISPALDAGSTTLEVWVKIPNAKAQLKPGTPVHVAIEAKTHDNVTTVPAESVITTKGGVTAVMVVGDDHLAHQRVVKLGVSDGKDTEVLEGVKAGEMIVTTGASSLEDKTKVEVGPAEDDDAKPGADAADAKPAAGEDK
jgi:RND family efflux transporter MFP subunit